MAAARRLFGTDGVRGLAGVELTATLARRLGAAAASFALERAGPPAEIVIGRDTRRSGPELEAAVAEGVAAAGGSALVAGVLPTPGLATVARERGSALACAVSASHNPWQDNGIKFLAGDGRKLADADEARIEALLDAPAAERPGSRRPLPAAEAVYVEWLLERFGDAAPALAGRRFGLDCANGAAHAVAPRLLARLGADFCAIGVEPDGRNINAGVGSTHLDALRALVARELLDFGVAFDGDADRCLAVDSGGRLVDGDRIMAILAIDLERRGELAEGRVVVTSMTNLGFHRLMEEHGIGVEVTDVGDRYVAERMQATGVELGGEQSGHVVWSGPHTTGDGLATALMLTRALERLDLSMDGAADVFRSYPQRLVAVRADRAGLASSERIWHEVDRANAALGRDGRVLVRASGTEPLVRVMVEAASQAECRRLCDHVADVVRSEIGQED